MKGEVGHVGYMWLLWLVSFRAQSCHVSLAGEGRGQNSLVLSVLTFKVDNARPVR